MFYTICISRKFEIWRLSPPPRLDAIYLYLVLNSSIDWIVFVGFILSEIYSAPLRLSWQLLLCLLCWGCARTCDDDVYDDNDDGNTNYEDYDDGNNDYDD